MTGDEGSFRVRLAAVASEVVEALEGMLGSESRDGEIARPPRLLAAMRHGVLSGGKRLRPFLLIESARLCGVSGQRALRSAAALECVHCYSLIHDDLPAMDDDDLRRGEPTVHRVFDDATAILAGDSLLTLAFEIIADEATHGDAAVRVELVAMLARASGIGGMAGGQMLDLENEARPAETREALRVHEMKTGALIRFACEAGAVVAQAPSEQRQALSAFGRRIGIAFQLADDILDVTASTDKLGKQAAKDSSRRKATLVAILGLAEARRMADRLLAEAEIQLELFGDRANLLRQAARFIVRRDH
jgi:farnesyl diphosphate synthase